jgi:hypothetical protein
MDGCPFDAVRLVPLEAPAKRTSSSTWSAKTGEVRFGGQFFQRPFLDRSGGAGRLTELSLANLCFQSLGHLLEEMIF